MVLPYAAHASNGVLSRSREFLKDDMETGEPIERSEAGSAEAVPSEQTDAVAPPAAKPSPLRRRNVRIGLAIGMFVVLGAIAAWFIYHQTTGRYFQSTDDAFIQADAVTVAPRVSGYVDEVFVTENQQVEAGQPLLQIDAREYRAQAAQANAQISLAAANAANVRAQIREQRAAVDRAQAQLDAALSDLGFARQEIARYEPLVESGAEPRERLAQLRNQLDQAQAQVATRRAEAVSARRRIGSLESQVDQARAQGEAGRAQLEATNVDVGSTMVRASSAGRIGSKSVEPGQFVQAGTRLMSIVPVRQLYIEANFKETQVGLMRIGQPVTIEVDALSDVELHGRIESFSPGTGAQFSLLPPENATGNFTKIVQRIPVRIAIDPAPAARALLIPGMSVEVTVDTRAAKGELERVQEQQQGRSERAGD